MAFSDDLARDPKSDKEFWTIIEDTFVQVEGVLNGYPVETQEEALAGTLRLRGDGTFRDPTADIVRYRNVGKDVDSRDYFLKLGRKFVPKVERQLKSRRLTPKFVKDWGVVMMCHGFISAHILDDSDGFSHVHAGQKSGKTRSKNPQRKWVARQILAIMETGSTRTQAEAKLGAEIAKFIKTGQFPLGFDREWFASILDENTALRDAYGQKRITKPELKRLASQPNDDVPSINFSR
jgi:hypothetical protein